ncbi:MAG: hypothetical protein PWQ17_2251 [Anaerophaga sp.]|nr:hypothetical protein [Anaerophaga sp.]MDN5290315.1 hypothetical protein [Anaerophaga sp.]
MRLTLKNAIFRTNSPSKRPKRKAFNMRGLLFISRVLQTINYQLFVKV